MVWMMHGPAARHATEYLAIPKAGLATWLHGFKSCIGLIEEQNIHVATLLCCLKSYIGLIKERDIEE